MAQNTERMIRDLSDDVEIPYHPFSLLLHKKSKTLRNNVLRHARVGGHPSYFRKTVHSHLKFTSNKDKRRRIPDGKTL